MAKRIDSRGCFQGDVAILPVTEIPQGLVEVQREQGKIIVTHSETGHHHVIERPRVTMHQDADPLIAWLEVHDEADLPQIAELVHERDFDTHETWELPVGKYKVVRQRERAPEGWQRAQD
jgi:hypothetical protein